MLFHNSPHLFYLCCSLIIMAVGSRHPVLNSACLEVEMLSCILYLLYAVLFIYSFTCSQTDNYKIVKPNNVLCCILLTDCVFTLSGIPLWNSAETEDPHPFIHPEKLAVAMGSPCCYGNPLLEYLSNHRGLISQCDIHRDNHLIPGCLCFC